MATHYRSVELIVNFWFGSIRFPKNAESVWFLIKTDLVRNLGILNSSMND